MSVTDDVVLVAQLLRCSEIGRVWVGEPTRLDMLDGYLDLEGHVRFDSTHVFGMDELRRGHVSQWRDGTHWRRIAGTPFELLAVRKGQVDGQAKVNEIVRGGQGWRLALSRVSLPILCEVGADGPAVQR